MKILYKYLLVFIMYQGVCIPSTQGPYYNECVRKVNLILLETAGQQTQDIYDTANQYYQNVDTRFAWNVKAYNINQQFNNRPTLPEHIPYHMRR